MTTAPANLYRKNVSGVITDHPDVARELRAQQSENQYFLQRILNRLRFIF